jgi:hypothetical protein
MGGAIKAFGDFGLGVTNPGLLDQQRRQQADDALKTSQLEQFQTNIPTLLSGLSPEQQQSVNQLAGSAGISSALIQGRALQDQSQSAVRADRAEKRFQAAQEATTANKKRFETQQFNKQLDSFEKQNKLSSPVARLNTAVSSIRSLLIPGATPKSLAAGITAAVKKDFGKDPEFQKSNKKALAAIFDKLDLDSFFGGNVIPENFTAEQAAEVEKQLRSRLINETSQTEIMNFQKKQEALAHIRRLKGTKDPAEQKQVKDLLKMLKGE